VRVPKLKSLRGKLAVLMAGFILPLQAQQAPPRLLHLHPAGAGVGSTTEVVVSGADLGATQALRFSHAGIRATFKETNRFEVVVGDGILPGTYEARVVNRRGISNPRAFAVGVLKEVAEAKNSRDEPQRLALESTINGRADASAVDYFRCDAKQGQRVLVRCDAREIDSKLDPVLTMLDAAGRDVARSRSGGLLDYTVASDGELTVRLHDVTYRGGAEFFYRLSLGTFPHVDYMLPVASGEKTTFAVFGRNLPGATKAKSGLERMDVVLSPNDPALAKPLVGLPAQAALDLVEYRARNERGVSEPVLIRFPTSPVISEQEPNNTLASAREISPPCEVAGEFHPNGDRDWFRFTAKKGDVFWIEVVSHRLGYATDPLAIVQRVTTNGATDVVELNESEANFGGPEFNTTHRDPSGRFEAKEDGTFAVQVRDLFTRPKSSSPAVYQLALRKPAPDFRLVALPGSALPAKKDAKEIGLTTTALRRGETMPVKLLAFRRDGFDGEIVVGPGEFPSNVVATPCQIESGKNSALMFVRAADEADASVGIATLRGMAPIGGSNVSRAVAPATIVWGTPDPANEAVVARTTAEPVFSVVDELVPVRVHPESNVVETVANKTVKVNFLIDRRASAAGGVKLKPYGLAALDSVPEVDVDANATNLVLQIDLKEKKVPVGTHAFALQVSPQAKQPADKSKKPKDPPPAFYSEPVMLRVNPAPTNSAAKK